MFAGHEAGRPQCRAAADAAASRHRDEGRQIIGGRAEPVTQPRTKAWPAGLGKAGVEKYLPGRVVKLFGIHRLDDGDVVHHLRQMRQLVRELRAALAVFGKRKARPQHGGITLDKGVALITDYRRRKRLALQRPELGLFVEEFQLARRTGHEKVNRRLGIRRDVRWSRLAKGISQQPSQRQLAHAVTALVKKVPARDRLRISCG